ncbi:site-specific integrase [Piscinibacter sp. XHJ-5]|uniref:site-specific integrase n=1 Tax=Piscinibacter sp. XHJ-5 TaxID=3037797 RepID=UPI002453128B|nr:site-specific integrase [Piscinibacter sp. XHJ-5]
MKVVFTDVGCSICERTCSGLPVFVGQERVLWDPSDWLRKRFLGGLAPRSVRTYASHLCGLLDEMEREEITWATLSDEWLLAHFNKHLKNAPRTAPQALRTQLEFLAWLEANGRAKNLIGIGDLFRIELDDHGRWIWRGKRLKPISLPSLPSHEAIEATIENLEVRDPGLNSRNEFMMKWQSIVGLRAQEVCLLRIDQLPSRGHAEKLLDQRRAAKIKLTVTKGAASRTVSVHPLLVLEAHDWIENDREQILERVGAAARARRVSYAAPNTVFLSNRGTPLNPRAYSNLIRTAFKNACTNHDVDPTDRVWCHGLRHRGLTDDLAHRRDAGQRAPALHTMHQAGHRSLASLSPYIHLVDDDSVMPPEPPSSDKDDRSNNRRADK